MLDDSPDGSDSQRARGCSQGAVDLDAISDPHIRAATESQINEFGNTPSQLLKQARMPRDVLVALCAFGRMAHFAPT